MKKEARQSNQAKFTSRPGRVLTIAGCKWKVQIGNSCVVAYCEDGRHVTDTPWRIKGVTPDTYERGQWKKNNDGSLLPREISAWLESQLPA